MSQCLGANQFLYQDKTDIPEDAEAFLALLTDCTYIDVKGKDTSRTRVISVLIHGSEPSGFIGMHRWLRAELQPHTNIRFIIASVSAAQKKPVFTHRYLPDEVDLNRCFNGCDDPKMALRATLIVELIKACDGELVVDLHNTSAPSSAFCISRFDNPAELALSSFFCDRMVLTKLNVGSLLEQDLGCPFITVECGASDCSAHELAYQGIKALARCEDFKPGHHYQPVQVMRNPLRVELTPGASLIYADKNLPQTDLVIKADIESRNMDIIPKGYCLGWINGDESIMVVRDEFGIEIENECLKVEQGQLVAKHDLQMFMATNIVEMAISDCLFYVINLNVDPNPLKCD